MDLKKPKPSQEQFWLFGKQLSESTSEGASAQSLLDELNETIQEEGGRSLNKGNASRFRTAYNVYVKQFGYSLAEVKRFSIYDLYAAHKSLGIASDRAEADKLLARLRVGEPFTAITKSLKMAKKTRAEHILEGFKADLMGATLKSKAATQSLFDLTDRYRAQMKEARGDALACEHLLRAYFQDVVKLGFGA